jgi:nitrite reductase (NO-forming)
MAALIFLYIVLRRHHSLQNTLLLGAFFAGVMLFFWFPIGIALELQYPFGIKTYGPADGPALPLKNVLAFFGNLSNFQRVPDIARDPRDVPPRIASKSEEKNVSIELTVKEVLSEVAPGVQVNIDLHAVTGPGGGATVTDVKPGESKTFQFNALNPGYMCTTVPIRMFPITWRMGCMDSFLSSQRKACRLWTKELYVMQGCTRPDRGARKDFR